MPLFRAQENGKHVWIPRERMVLMESSDGRLTTLVHALIIGPKGPGLMILEAEGTCQANAEAIEASEKAATTLVAA